MKITIFIYSFLISFVLSQSSFSMNWNSHKDSTKSFLKHKKFPVLEVSVSDANFNNNNLASPFNFNSNLSFQINLGYKTFVKTHPAQKYFIKFLSLAYSSDKFINNDNRGGNIANELWEIIASSEIGYRYGTGLLGLSPYYSSGYSLYNFSYSFSTVCPTLYGIQCVTNSETLNRFTNGIHFGKSFEQGIKIDFGKKLAIKAGFSEQLFFARFMTWKFLGSELLYGIGRVALDKFNRNIIQNSPKVGAIIDVALVSGLNYLVYYFQKSNMNWPFNSEAPISYERFKLGISLTF